ncbi:ZPBP2 protein, partial [Rhinopomastus cyanomelas]|nr:ZPBP2 protein [Rhinopomastus cyanomelas]
GRMLCAPVGRDLRRLGLPGTLAILTLVLCSCSGQPVSLPPDLPATSSQEHQWGLVFIHMDSSHYSLPCSPMKMKVAEPTYSWVKVGAESRKLFSITKEGHLLFQHFQANDSGMYSCTVSYKKHGVPVSQVFHYGVFGYHVLGRLEARLLFYTEGCENKWTKRFLWDLKEKMRQMEIKQHCKFHHTATFCFPTLSSHSDKFVTQVHLEVSPFGPQWDERCNSQDAKTLTDCYRRTVQYSLGQVELTLNKFFKEHQSFQITGTNNSDINFTNKFLSILKFDKCNGGYGQTKQLQRCLSCCIVCPPGMFSSPKNGQCSPCPSGTYSQIYGAESCTSCKADTITQRSGASSVMDCVRNERTKQAVLIKHRIPSLILIVLPTLITLNFIFILTSCYKFCREYPVSSPGASEMEGETTEMEAVNSTFQVTRKGLQA